MNFKVFLSCLVSGLLMIFIPILYPMFLDHQLNFIWTIGLTILGEIVVVLTVVAAKRLDKELKSSNIKGKV